MKKIQILRYLNARRSRPSAPDPSQEAEPAMQDPSGLQDKLAKVDVSLREGSTLRDALARAGLTLRSYIFAQAKMGIKSGWFADKKARRLPHRYED